MKSKQDNTANLVPNPDNTPAHKPNLHRYTGESVEQPLKLAILAMHDSGQSVKSIAEQCNLSRNLVTAVIRLQQPYKKVIEHLKERQADDLFLLQVKARENLHKLLDEGNVKVIENVAVMDRSFQQQRLLEGSSTQNISYMDITSSIAELDARERKLRAELGIEDIDNGS